MRIGIVLENKSDFPFGPGDPDDLDSELFSESEEDALLSGLRDAGHDVVRIGDGRRLIARPAYWRRRVDLVFNLSVGYRGTYRKSLVPGALELARIPYVGSDPYVLSLTRHKHHAKLVVQAAGIATAPSVLWSGPENTAELASLQYPAIVKPVAESSSIGIDGRSVVEDAASAEERARWVVETLHQPALVEGFVRGTEVEVPLLGAPEVRPLGVVAITIDGNPVRGDLHLASDDVYSDQYGFETNVDWLDSAAVSKAGVAAARALGIRDYGRIDFRVAEDGTPFFMEASTHPHIQPHSSFFALMKQNGKNYPDMLDEIVLAAVQRLRVLPRRPQSSQNSMSQ